MTDVETPPPPPATKPSICAVCGQTFSNKQKLSAHKRMVHPGAPPQGHAPRSKTDSDYGKKGEHVCPFCRKRFPSPQSLGAHKRHDHPGQSVRAMAKARNQAKKTKGQFRCPECGRTFLQAKHLGSHRRRIHGIVGKSTSAARGRVQRSENTPSPAIGIATCEECGRVFKNAFGLTIHQATIHGIAGKKTARYGASTHQTFERSNDNGNFPQSSSNAEAEAYWISRGVTQFEQICADNAPGANLLPAEFASRVMAIFQGSSKTLRTRYRLPH